MFYIDFSPVFSCFLFNNNNNIFNQGKPGVSIVAGLRVDLPACNGPITRLEPSHERQLRPDNFISASNSCQKI